MRYLWAGVAGQFKFGGTVLRKFDRADSYDRYVKVKLGKDY